MMKILAVTYGGGHVRIATKIADAYKRHGIDYQIVALPAAIPYLREQNIPYKRLIDFADFFSDWDSIFKLGENLAKKFHNANAGFSIEDTICYYGMSYYDLLTEYGEAEASALFEKNGRKVFYPKESAKIIIKAASPDIVQTTSGVRMERAVSNAARELGIPSARIQDCPLKLDEMTSDYFFVLNEYEKKRNSHLVQNPDKQIIVTGHPCFEKYPALKKDTEREKVARNLKLDRQYLIVWAVSGYKDEKTTQLFLALRKISEIKPDINIVVKLHPTSHSEDMFSEYGELPKNMRVIKDYDTPSLLKAADLVIGEDSTTAFEAFLLDTTEIIVDRRDDEYLTNLNYYKTGLLNSLDNLESEIDKFLYNEDVRQYYAEQRKGLTAFENASENIADAMNTIYKSC